MQGYLIYRETSERGQLGSNTKSIYFVSY